MGINSKKTIIVNVLMSGLLLMAGSLVCLEIRSNSIEYGEKIFWENQENIFHMVDTVLNNPEIKYVSVNSSKSKDADDDDVDLVLEILKEINATSIRKASDVRQVPSTIVIVVNNFMLIGDALILLRKDPHQPLYLRIVPETYCKKLINEVWFVCKIPS